MKRILFLSVLFLICSCSKDPESTTTTFALPDGTSYSVEASSNELRVSFECEGEWSLSESSEWCTPSSSSGSGSTTLLFSIDENLFSSSREAQIYLAADGYSTTLKITQSEASEQLLYQLPVIFHIFYDDPASQEQNLAQSVINQIVEECNAILRNQDPTQSVDLGVELLLATHDPDGNELTELGIERIQVANATMESTDFLYDFSNVQYIWDVDTYVNVMIFPFTDTGTLGISFLAFNPSSSGGLEGLYDGSYYFTNALDFPYCISLNVDLIDQSNVNPLASAREGSITLAHELGHLLGLFHPFLEDGHYDYCDDTYHYVFTDYITYLQSLSPFTIVDALKRPLVDGSVYAVADNLMDYDYNMYTCFTQDQSDRIRYILENGVLIPGPKQDRSQLTKTIAERPTPRLITCSPTHTACSH